MNWKKLMTSKSTGFLEVSHVLGDVSKLINIALLENIQGKTKALLKMKRIY